MFPEGTTPLLLPYKTKTRFRPTVTTTATKSEQPKPTNQETLQPPKKPITKNGVGFGSTSSPSSSQTQDSKKKRRASIVRRTPLEKPSFLSQQGKTPQPIQQQSQNETVLLLTWSGLSLLIIVEGLALSTSGTDTDQLKLKLGMCGTRFTCLKKIPEFVSLEYFNRNLGGDLDEILYYLSQFKYGLVVPLGNLVKDVVILSDEDDLLVSKNKLRFAVWEDVGELNSDMKIELCRVSRILRDIYLGFEDGKVELEKKVIQLEKDLANERAKLVEAEMESVAEDEGYSLDDIITIMEVRSSDVTGREEEKDAKAGNTPPLETVSGMDNVTFATDAEIQGEDVREKKLVADLLVSECGLKGDIDEKLYNRSRQDEAMEMMRQMDEFTTVMEDRHAQVVFETSNEQGCYSKLERLLKDVRAKICELANPTREKLAANVVHEKEIATVLVYFTSKIKIIE
ncbi:hypothetical protein GIB67_008742 [Kingdonia uniflora]|uniref:Uncharacterized protein n=1 Tax=Kingdonia uniflora TaxID=39325 RepID=A0A7J7P5E9_9MAGN|nr:hypothetical protein GIB67_008742 [Kingdonia uniflora]